MRFTFCLILASLIFTEASALNTTQPISIFNSNNPDEEKAYVKNAAIASTVSSHIQIGNNKNISLASFLISANESANLNLIPVLLGSIKISWNLALTGRMSAFSNKNKAINAKTSKKHKKCECKILKKICLTINKDVERKSLGNMSSDMYNI